AKGGDDALGGGKLRGRGRVGAIHRRDLVRMHAAAALKSAAAAALERTREGFGLVEVEPRAVDRVLQPGGARGEHDARADIGELRLVQRRRKPERMRIVCRAE